MSEIDRHMPLRLAVAAEEAYGKGGMTASGLRREAKRGRLVIERVAGKDYTTLAAIDRMRELCRVPQPARTGGSGQSAATKQPTTSPTEPSGSSSTVDFSRAQSAAETTVAELKRSLSTISTQSTAPRRKPGSVIRLKSPSPTS